jgi:hypothetical protein
MSTGQTGAWPCRNRQTLAAAADLIPVTFISWVGLLASCCCSQCLSRHTSDIYRLSHRPSDTSRPPPQTSCQPASCRRVRHQQSRTVRPVSSELPSCRSHSLMACLATPLMIHAHTAQRQPRLLYAQTYDTPATCGPGTHLLSECCHTLSSAHAAVNTPPWWPAQPV